MTTWDISESVAPFQRIELEKLRIGCTYVFDAMDVTERRDLATESVMLSFRSHVLAEKLVDDHYTEYVDTPANVWQMFKERHMPEWFVRRFPVRYDRREVVVRFQRYATYPDAHIRPNRDKTLGKAVLYELATRLETK